MKKKIFITILFFSIVIICTNLLTKEIYAASSNYKFDDDKNPKIVYRIEPKTNASEFLTNITTKLKTSDTDVIKLYKFGESGYEEVSSGIVKSGMLAVKNLHSINDVGDGRYSMNADRIYKASVIGDISEDGETNIIDLSALIRHYIGLSNYVITDGYLLKSADFYDDDVINPIDITYLIRYILNGTFPNIEKQDYTMSLSETSGETTCPNEKIFTVTNPTGGKISAITSNGNIATASVSGSTITITPIAPGTTTIKVTSEETAKYKAGSATYTIMVNKGIGYITLSATEGVVVKDETISFNVTSKHGNKTQLHIDNALVADAKISNGLVTVTGINAGNTKITLTAPENDSYTEATAVYNVTCIENSSNQQNYTMQLSETSGETTYPYLKTFRVTNPTGGKISAVSSNNNVATTVVSDSTITIIPKGVGTTTINVSSAATTNYKAGNATYTIKVNNASQNQQNNQQDYTMRLSETRGVTSIPNTKTFTIMNPTGGTITVATSNSNIATARVSGTTITVIPQNVGSAIITVLSDATANYKSGTATYIITVNEGSVTNKQDYTMQLSEISGTTTCPNTKTIIVTNPTGGKISALSYDGNIATASVNESNILITPVGKGTTTIVVTSEETDKYKAGFAEYTITVNKGVGYITLSANEGTVVKDKKITFNISSKHGNRTEIDVADTKVVTAKIENNVVTVTGVGVGTTKITVRELENNAFTEATAVYNVTCITNSSNQQDYTMRLSETSGTIKYPNTKTITVTNPTGGRVMAVTSNSKIATTSVSGSTITITPKGIGTTTITISSAETEYYKAGNATYTIRVDKGTGFITLSDTNGIVNVGKMIYFNITNMHGTSVKIKNSNSAVVDTDIFNNQISIIGMKTGTSTITVTAQEDDYYTEASATYSVTCISNQEDYTMELSENYGVTTCPNVKTFKVTNPTGGKITVQTSDTGVATASVSGSTITVTPVGQGVAYIHVSSEETDDYTSGSAVYQIRVNKGEGYIRLSEYEGTIRVGQEIRFYIVEKTGNKVELHNDNAYVVEAHIDNGIITLYGREPGTSHITLITPEDNAYTGASTCYVVTCIE
ncbi:MAG: dockerin type I repeat-containing protein [Clostridia bacterium]|nr:dockerin type I repeat-containing protein [Clostridia bacterium]